MVHFYETFLAAYDPAMREIRGVFYTPEPAVSYIVRSIDWLLKTRLGRPKGLADENTLILDKISMLLEQSGYTFGSDQRLGIYLTNTLEEAAKKSAMLLGQFISREANAAAEIKRECPIMVVLGNPPYANFGRMNRGEWILNLLKDYKRDLHEKKLNLDDDYIKFIRFAQWRIEQTGYGILGYITNNSYLDGITHRRMRQALMQTFDEIYVLNLHGSSMKKEKAPDGGKDENVFDITVGVSILLAVKLARGLSEGDPPPASRTPPEEGSIFGSPPPGGCPQGGVGSDGKPMAHVFHADLWGRREIYEDDQLTGGKYHWLWQNDARTTAWQELTPAMPNFFFVPKDATSAQEYEVLLSCSQVFDVFGNGIGTDRDALFHDVDLDKLSNRMQFFFTPAALEHPFAPQYRIEDSSSCKILSRRQAAKFSISCLRQCIYRPFDFRWLYYDANLVSRAGFDVMQHMAAPNVALLLTRQVTGREFCHVFVSRHLVDRDPLSLITRERTQVFPLYLYPSEGELDVSAGRHPNLSPEFLKELAEKLKAPQEGPHGLPKGVTPEDIFHYAYAVFHSPSYRQRYAEFLKSDFPRLPLTGNRDLFFRLATLGAELVGLHLMESPKLNNLITEFPQKGTDVVEKVTFTVESSAPSPPEDGRDGARPSKGTDHGCSPPGRGPRSGGWVGLPTGRVWINSAQFFGDVPTTVWNFHIGGYQVCEKWLKDRKGRKLTYEDTQHYQKIVVALSETIRLMDEVDRVIEAAGAWPLK